MATGSVRDLSAEELANAFYVAQQSHARRVTDRVQQLWREIDRRDLSRSWAIFIGPEVVRTVTAGQLATAAAADAYVESIIAAGGLSSDPAGRVRPEAFAGLAADGRSLDTLLDLPLITSKTAVAAGADEVEAMMTGLQQLLRMAASEVTDAGRAATGVSIAGNRTINGYIRVVNPPACSRCIILAGREYGWNTGFQRHPKCDCTHMPAKLIARDRHIPGAFDPQAYFKGLSRAEQDRIFTEAGAKAIRDGADMNSVVNARRGMYTAADGYGGRVRATYEGTTRRGLYFQMERSRAYRAGTASPRYPRRFQLSSPRLLPEQIYRLAGSRDEAISLLRQYGYLGWSV
jgi:hypothetical protein